jgi:hypothetical protein
VETRTATLADDLEGETLREETQGQAQILGTTLLLHLLVAAGAAAVAEMMASAAEGEDHLHLDTLLGERGRCRDLPEKSWHETGIICHVLTSRSSEMCLTLSIGWRSGSVMWPSSWERGVQACRLSGQSGSQQHGQTTKCGRPLT